MTSDLEAKVREAAWCRNCNMIDDTTLDCAKCNGTGVILTVATVARALDYATWALPMTRNNVLERFLTAMREGGRDG